MKEEPGWNRKSTVNESRFLHFKTTAVCANVTPLKVRLDIQANEALPHIFTGQGFMSKAKDNPKSDTPKIRPKWVFFWAIAFFVLLDVIVRIYFAQPNLLLRNIDRGIGSLPYLFSQMDKHEGPKIAFVGASVMQGYQNVAADRTFSALVERQLNATAKYKGTKSFNLASAGHNFGDHYCLLAETIRHKPDLIVVAMHFKSFSQHISTGVPIQHKSLVNYISNDPKRDEMLRRFQISKTDYYLYRLDGLVRRISAFYRYHELIPQMISGSADSPPFAILDHYKAALGLYSTSQAVARMHDPEDRSTDYLWKLLPEQLVMHNHEICSNLDFSDSNVNWRSFKDICELGRKEKVNILFYLTPINKAIVTEQNFFDWNILRNYKQVVIQQVRQNGHLLADVTNAVDAPYFSDTDHLNMNGHAQVSRKMTKEIKKALDRGGWKPTRRKTRRD
jgi:hypothetical protein